MPGWVRQGTYFLLGGERDGERELDLDLERLQSGGWGHSRAQWPSPPQRKHLSTIPLPEVFGHSRAQ